MKLNSIAVFFTVVIHSLSCFSQNSLDILNLSGRYGLPSSYVDTYHEKATETGTYLNLTVPILITENFIWYNSLNHFFFNVDGASTIPAEQINPIKINGFILRTGIYRKFKNGSGIQLLFVPRLMSDLKNIDRNSFQFGGVFMYEKAFRNDLNLSFGGMYNQELFGPYVVPIVNIYWQLSEKWQIRGLFPISLKVMYKAGENLTVGLNHFGLITSYYLSAPDNAGDYIERKCIDLALFARQKLFTNFYIEGKAGRTFGRSYTQYSGDQKVDFSLPLIGFGDNRIAKNTTFNDGFFIDIGIVYNIRISE